MIFLRSVAEQLERSAVVARDAVAIGGHHPEQNHRHRRTQFGANAGFLQRTCRVVRHRQHPRIARMQAGGLGLGIQRLAAGVEELRQFPRHVIDRVPVLLLARAQEIPRVEFAQLDRSRFRPQRSTNRSKRGKQSYPGDRSMHRHSIDLRMTLG